ncbi:BspA family leucine-rich repeat surface protein [archaeon]|nr:MAG: BspA family leucine-rich repeat surface protein [archaeon]
MSHVDNMNKYACALNFDQPIGSWSVSRVTSMCTMFYGAKSFNQFIGQRDVSSVGNMSDIFHSVMRFSQPIGQ